MKIRDLEIFLHLLKTKSPTHTAEHFKITQPNVSIIVKNIERAIGGELFERVGKKLLPTSKAMFLGGMWLEVVQGYYKSLEIAGEDEISLGQIHITSSPTIGEYLLPTLLFDFAKDYPKTKIFSSIHPSQECIKLLKMGKVDIALIEGEISEEYAKNEGFIREIICQDKLIIATNDFVLSTKKRELDELMDKYWVLREFGSTLRDKFLQEVKRIGKEVPIFLELDRTNAIKDIVINRGAISVFSKLTIAKEIESGVLFPLEIEGINLTRYFYSLKRKSYIANLAIEKFDKFISQHGFI